mgnify:CR=1 FL=1
MEKYLSREEVKTIINQAPKGSNPESLIKGLVSRGYTLQGLNDQPKEVEKPNTMSRLGTDLLQRAKNVKETAVDVFSNPTEPFAKEKMGLRLTGQAAGAVGDVIGAGINAATGGGIDKLGEYIASTETGQQLGQILAKVQKESPELAGQLGDLFNIATVGVGGVAAKPVAKAIGTGLREGAESTATGAVKAGKFLKEGISPTPTLGKALEEATVAKTAQEIPAFQKAISSIDTTDVKTFADLNKKFKEAIPTISKQVDDELLKDTNVYRIEDLLIPQVTKAGKEIKTDYITRALDGLDDLYTKLGDDVAKADVQDLIAKAQTQGLTRLEVNNLARQYNSEYGSKAFTATGDIKQGFNAEVYESTRKGLKDIARGGLGGEQAKALDSSLTAIYDAQRLAERNANAVQAMKTRIEEKGWVGKGIRGAFDISDMLTGGAVRALRDTVLARGNAQKLQNVLELENKLKKNLEVINKAMKAPTEAKAVEILNTLPKEKGMLQTAIDNLKDPKKRQGGYIANPLSKKLPTKDASLSSVNNTTDLLSEAKKYKSAEEFVKAQGTPVYRGGVDLSKEKITNSGISVSSGKNVANDFVKQKGGTVQEHLISPEAKIINYADVPNVKFKNLNDYSPELDTGNRQIWRDLEVEYQKAVDWAKAKGYDGVKLPLEGETRIINPEVLKTKSQLEDIWKQAQGKSPKKEK